MVAGGRGKHGGGSRVQQKARRGRRARKAPVCPDCGRRMRRTSKRHTVYGVKYDALAHEKCQFRIRPARVWMAVQGRYVTKVDAREERNRKARERRKMIREAKAVRA